MFTFAKKPSPSAAPSTSPKPASQRLVQKPPVNPLWFRRATLTNSGPAASTEMTEEWRRYFEPILPAPSRVLWLRTARAASRANLEDEVSPPVVPGPQFDFARVPIMPSLIQRRPAISSPNDPFERKADEVADKVMRMVEPAPMGTTPVANQRKPAAHEVDEEETIQARPVPSGNPEAALDEEAAGHTAERDGAPLPQAARGFFKPRFGRDFSHVRVHADGEAASAARAVGARAYTVGRNIMFGSGEYAPNGAEGRRLLAHELAHVVQRSSAPLAATMPRIQRSPSKSDDEQPSVHSPQLSAPDVSTVIHFPTLGTTLDADDLKVLDLLVTEAAVRSDFNELDFQIEGYADERPVSGNPKGNQKLSESRAASTRASLQEKFNALPGGLPKKALLRSQLSHKGSGVPAGSESHPLQRRADVKIVVKPTLLGQRLISRTSGQPEMLSVDGAGVTTKKIAIELYGDEALSGNMTVRAPGSFGPDAELPKGSTVQIQYPSLRPRLKAAYDVNMTVTPRSEWGARAPITKDPKRSYERYTGKLEDILDSIVVHHSGNSNLHTMKEVQDEQMDKQERADIAYHYGIDRQGNTYEGRSIDVKGAHVDKANTGKIGVVLLADLDTQDTGMIFPDINGDDTLTPKMEASLLKLIHYLRGKYPKVTQLGGHTEFAAAQGDERGCPGDLTMAKMSGWRSSLGMDPPAKEKP
jgi:outer membrane protein OmpA-like peptidoglycan-associated protein